MFTQLGRGLSRPNHNQTTTPAHFNTNMQTIAAIGDSLVAQHSSMGPNINAFENVGWLNVVNYKMHNRFIFNHNLNFGLSGDTTSGMNARKESMAGFGANIYFVLGGTNDIADKAPASSIISNLNDIFTYIKNTLGGIVYAVTILPRSFWPSSFSQADINQAKSDIITINNWIKSQTGIHIIDAYSLWDDGLGEPMNGYDIDGVHCAPTGASVIADEIISHLMPTYGLGAPLNLNTNIFDNGTLSGIGGTIPEGCNGVSASNYSIQTIGATTDNSWRSFSKNENDALEINISAPQGNGTVGIILSQRINEGSDYDNNVQLKSACHLDIKTVNGDFDSINYEIRHEGSPNGNEYIISMDESASAPIPNYGEGVMRTPNFVPTNSTRLRGRVIISGNTSNGPINCRVIIKGMHIGVV